MMTPSRGFTLIELSIVLVIIGLMVGAIVGGKALIHQARLNKVIADMNGYKTAVNAFILQYNAFPGDFNEAYSYWGSSCSGNAVSCNGDNSGRVTDCATCSIPFQEPLMLWRHLYLADLLPFALTGSQNNSGLPAWAAIDWNVPSGPIDGTGYALGWTTLFGKPGHAVYIGRVPPGENYLRDGAMAPKDAASIDKKIDDGLAASGKVRPSYSWTGNVCTNGVDPGVASTGSYNLSNPAESCLLAMFLD